MDWVSKAKRILKHASMVLCALGLAGWVWAMSVYQSYLNLPSSPNPATGSIYPLNIHGSVVYQTLQQKLYRAYRDMLNVTDERLSRHLRKRVATVSAFLTVGF